MDKLKTSNFKIVYGVGREIVIDTHNNYTEENIKRHSYCTFKNTFTITMLHIHIHTCTGYVDKCTTWYFNTLYSMLGQSVKPILGIQEGSTKYGETIKSDIIIWHAVI